MTTHRVAVLVACALVLTGCARVSESRFNPFNWFGGSRSEERVATVQERSDPRPLVARITALRVERTPSGAIIRATGVPPTQGWYAGELVPEADGPVGGVLAYRFRAAPPLESARVSTQQSRELVVAVSVSSITLADTRVIRVIGAGNALVSRR